MSILSQKMQIDMQLREYNTNTWTILEPTTSPGLLSQFTMLYIDSSDRVILFGGQVGSTISNYTNETPKP